jgi:hypothetical protein
MNLAIGDPAPDAATWNKLVAEARLARQLARSLVIIAEERGGVGEAERALAKKLPPDFVAAVRAEVRS